MKGGSAAQCSSQNLLYLPQLLTKSFLIQRPASMSRQKKSKHPLPKVGFQHLALSCENFLKNICHSIQQKLCFPGYGVCTHLQQQEIIPLFRTKTHAEICQSLFQIRSIATLSRIPLRQNFSQKMRTLSRNSFSVGVIFVPFPLETDSLTGFRNRSLYILISCGL